MPRIDDGIMDKLTWSCSSDEYKHDLGIKRPWVHVTAPVSWHNSYRKHAIDGSTIASLKCQILSLPFQAIVELCM